MIGGESNEVLVAALGALLATLVSLYVFLNSQRRLKFDFMVTSWKDWDSIYYAALSNEANLRSLYSLIYGENALSLEEMRARAFTHLILNDVFKTWIGVNQRFITRHSAKIDMHSSLSMLKRSENTAVSVLAAGGYPEEFVEFVKTSLGQVGPFSLKDRA